MTRSSWTSACALSAIAAWAAACGGASGDAQSEDASTPPAGDASDDDAGAAVDSDATASTSQPTSLSGTLGALGSLQPTVSSLVISNSGETLVYLSSAKITCEQLMVSRWLGSVDAGAQVVEIVVSGAPKLGTTKSAEVNYAPGGKSSAYEKNAKTSSVTFTKSEAMGVVEGTVDATYANPTGDLSGHFHAEFCAHGQDY